MSSTLPLGSKTIDFFYAYSLKEKGNLERAIQFKRIIETGILGSWGEKGVYCLNTTTPNKY